MARYRKAQEEVEEALERISEAFEEPEFPHLLLDTLHAAPSRLLEGLLVIADGSDWDPGSGGGVYVYFSGAWVKL